MFCPYCGDTLLANAQFCRNCGKEQPAPGALPTRTAAEDVHTRLSHLEKRVEAVAYEQRRNRFHLPVSGLGISLCAAALALFAFCFLPYVSYNASNTPSIQPAPYAPSYTFTGLQLIDLHAIWSDLQAGYPAGSSVGPKDFTVPEEDSLWLEPLVAFSILLLAFFQFLVSRTAKESSSEVSISIWIDILALLTILVMIFGQGRSQFDQGTFFQYAASGYWLFLGAFALALVGGIVQIFAVRQWNG